MKTGRILNDGNYTVLERETELWDDTTVLEEHICQYGTKYAYWEEDKIGSYQKYLGTRKMRGVISGETICMEEEIKKFPVSVTL